MARNCQASHGYQVICGWPGSVTGPENSHTFPARDYIGLPRQLTFSLLPTKGVFNPSQVFPLPPADGTEILPFSDGTKFRGRVGAAFVHLHASGSIIGSHILPLPGYISVFDVVLYASSCALQYAANLSPSSKIVSLSIDRQAAFTTISRPGYSYLAPLLHDIRKATSILPLSDTAVQVG